MPAANIFVNQTNTTAMLNYTGFSLTTFTENLGPSFGRDYTSNNIAVTFSSVFGVLFCGVTGILAGANMSGKKKIFLLVKYFAFNLLKVFIFFRRFEKPIL